MNRPTIHIYYIYKIHSDAVTGILGEEIGYWGGTTGWQTLEYNLKVFGLKRNGGGSWDIYLYLSQCRFESAWL